MTTHPRRAVLDRFGIGEGDLIGAGGESRVYALGATQVLRLPRQGRFDRDAQARLRAFLDRIAGRFPFATPRIEEVAADGSHVIEKRLPGRSMLDRLRALSGPERARAFGNYVEAIDALATVRLPDLPYGHVLADSPMTATDWRAFARNSLSGFLDRNRATIAREAGDPDRLFGEAAAMIAGLPERPDKALVHGDYFPGNVLLDDRLAVSAVIDFGVYTVVGDPQLDTAVACLTLELLDECTADDVRLVRGLILERCGEAIVPALRFYRAWLAFSMADPANAAPPYPRLYGWSLAMLKLLADGRLPA